MCPADRWGSEALPAPAGSLDAYGIHATSGLPGGCGISGLPGDTDASTLCDMYSIFAMHSSPRSNSILDSRGFLDTRGIINTDSVFHIYGSVGENTITDTKCKTDTKDTITTNCNTDARGITTHGGEARNGPPSRTR